MGGVRFAEMGPAAEINGLILPCLTPVKSLSGYKMLTNHNGVQVCGDESLSQGQEIGEWALKPGCFQKLQTWHLSLERGSVAFLMVLSSLWEAALGRRPNPVKDTLLFVQLELNQPAVQVCPVVFRKQGGFILHLLQHSGHQTFSR